MSETNLSKRLDQWLDSLKLGDARDYVAMSGREAWQALAALEMILEEELAGIGSH